MSEKPCGHSPQNSKLFMQQRQIELRDHEAQIAEDRRGLNLVQSEVDTHRQQHEQQFARLANERACLDSECDALRTQSAEFERLRQRHQIESRDRESQIAEDRRALSLALGELGASRQHLEQDLARLADARVRLDSEREAMRILSAEFESLRQLHHIELRDREARIADDHRKLSLAQESSVPHDSTLNRISHGWQTNEPVSMPTVTSCGYSPPNSSFCDNSMKSSFAIAKPGLLKIA